jgi:ubiquitin-conjugating enzyme E2 W
MKDHVPPGIEIVKSDNLEEWQMDIKVLDENPLYLNQTYRLKFTFSNKYPIGKSSGSFVGPHSCFISGRIPYSSSMNSNSAVSDI